MINPDLISLSISKFFFLKHGAFQFPSRSYTFSEFTERQNQSKTNDLALTSLTKGSQRRLFSKADIYKAKINDQW